MTTFTWLHLSDLHLRGTETSIDRAAFDEMLNDIKARCEVEHLVLDAVFFTGDAAFSGQKEQYDVVSEWFDKVLDFCGLPGRRDRFFIVPGNHDVNRKEVYRADYARDFHKELVTRLLDNDDCEEINKFLSLKPSPDRELAFVKLQNFACFTQDYFSDKESKFDHDKCYSVRSIEKEGRTIVVIGLNSTWLSFRDNEQGQLLLGEIQVSDALAEVQKKWPQACLRIALVHHPLYWLAEKDIHKTQQYLPGKCDILLRGHLHCPSFSVQSTPDLLLREFAAGASLKANYHAYNLVQLDLDTGEGTAIVRLQHPQFGPHWGMDDFTYCNTKHGKIGFNIE